MVPLERHFKDNVWQYEVGVNRLYNKENDVNISDYNVIQRCSADL